MNSKTFNKISVILSCTEKRLTECLMQYTKAITLEKLKNNNLFSKSY